MNLKYLPSFSKYGFTLVELLIVIAIVGILMAAVISVINPVEQQKKARDSVRRADLAKISTALEQYYADHNSYPSSPGGKLPAGITDYMKGNVPTEVISTYRYCYTATAGQNYVLCSVSESFQANTSSLGGSPCSVLSASGTNPDRYCIENPF